MMQDGEIMAVALIRKLICFSCMSCAGMQTGW